jgi:lipoprotein-anchoring transpeptidase ErfK/SrfK
MVPSRSRLRGVAVAASLLLAAAALSACNNGPDLPGAHDTSASSSSDPGGSGSGGSDPSSSSSPSGATRAGTISANVKKGASDVPVDTLVQVAAHNGRLSSVTVTGTGDAGTLTGAINGAGSKWKAGGLLEPGTTYSISAAVAGQDGKVVTRRQKFSTQDLSLSQQTYPSVAPLAGQTVGVGMPVIVTFDVPVTDRASMEQHMQVDATPAQPGTWHWLSDTEVHWRPKTFWKAGSKVDVHVDVNGVSAGNGIYGQENRDVSFNVGDTHIYKVNTQTDQMQVTSNGQLLRTIPITTGQQPAYTTRSGTKVIIEKFPSKEMNSETVGITGAEAYDIKGVQWAMRITYSGEFIHAAPWSVYAQGSENVSHGCTGMSTENADWLYHMTNVGDVVQYTGTDRPMEPTNGYGDWDIPWQQYREGSALYKAH